MKFSSIYNFVKNRDLFSKSITLTYHGKESFKTFGGGMSSLFIIIVMANYGINLMVMMFSKTNVNVKFTSVRLDMDQTNVTHKIFANDLIYGAFWIDVNSSMITEDYGVILAFHEKIKFSANNTNISTTPLATVEGDNVKYSYLTGDNGSPTGYKCLANLNETIETSIESTIVDSVVFRFVKCINQSIGKSDDEINEKLSNSLYGILMLDSYFDKDDLVEPVKKYSKQNAVLRLTPSYK